MVVRSDLKVIGYIFEGEVFDISLEFFFREFVVDEVFDIVDSVVGVGGSLVFGGVFD